MSGIMSMLLGAVSSAAAAVDEFFNRVTLLLPGNGTNGAQNNTFLDSSSNNFTITRNGNTTQGTFSPFSQTGWSNFFDGTGDYLQTASGSSTSFGAGDFCVECWFYKTSSTATGGYLVANLESNSDAQWALMITGTGLIRWQGWNTIWLNPSAPAINQWNHVAVCRSGTTLSLFVNGSRSATLSSHSNNYSATTDVRVGAYASGTDPFTGYISNARVIKGSTPYDPTLTTLTVPTAPLTAITNTSLLTCQSNRFIDNSTNAFAITRNGDTSVQAFSPFAPTAAYSAATVGGSGYFDGSGDYLTVADNAALEPVGNNFCIEFSYYPTSVSGTKTIVGKRSNPSTDYGFLVLADGANARVYISSANTSYDIVNGTIIGTLVTNQWHHIAIYRISNAWYASFNGSITTLNASNSSSVNNNAGTWGIGADSNGAAPVQGYMANTRFVIGSSVYTSTSAPFPTAPLTAITNTQLLLNYTNAGITDATAKNDLETVGNAQISTTQSKFGGSSMYFDGTGDYLKVPSSPNLALGTGDFTVEFWAYPTTFVNYSQWVSTRIGDDASYWGVDSNSSGVFYFFTNGIVVQSSAQSLNTWVHIAAVRSSGTFKLYINGVSAGSASLTNNFLIANGLGVGAAANGAQTAYGYIDDVRITRGYARYTTNFTPPTAAFALQ